MARTEKLNISADAPGARLLLLGNEAIARGAIEAGVQVVAAYPGTPSSEITEAFFTIKADLPDTYVEWSVNEKVALEVALAAAMCGVRAMAVMKHVGVNVAHEPLMSASYIGAVGGLVLVEAEDPGQWSSQNEQDNRFIAEQAYIPVLEPSSPQEAKQMVTDAFELSEKYRQIFMIRSVTRIGHARSDIELGKIRTEKNQGNFQKNPIFQCMPAWSRENRILMIEKLEKIKKAADKLPYNRLQTAGGAKLGIIACGISYSYAVEALRWLGLEDKVSLLKIGTPHPLPEELVKKLLNSVTEVLVIEEMEPFVENHVKVIAQQEGIAVKIHGKDVVPLRLELSTRKAAEAIMKITGTLAPADFGAIDRRVEEAAPLLPQRPPTLCAGCPHRGSFYAINVAARKVKKDMGERVLTGDIGCYSLGIFPPLSACDTATCMGSGFGLANGIARGTSAPVVGHLGDSTFFHSGIPPMINAVFNQTNITMVVLDNSATAMTGFQPHPGTPGNNENAIKPEDVARACNVKFVRVINPFDVTESAKVIEEAIRFEGPAVIVSRGICSILGARERRQRGEKTVPYSVDAEKCTDCRLCLNSLGCPAIVIEDEKVVIDSTLCDGCGVCAEVCPAGAIVQEGGNQ